MANEVFESGFSGSLYSLGGIKGKEGAGRQSQRYVVGLSAGVGAIGIPANGKRISATVQFTNSQADLQVFFGDSIYGPVFYLRPYDLLQVDADLPWTGAIYLFSAAAVSVIISETTVIT